MEKTKSFYRVNNLDKTTGLWYNNDGKFTGLINSKYDNLKASALPMPFDTELVGWVSAIETLEHLFEWFTLEELKSLQKDHFFISEFAVVNYKHYEKYNHPVIEQSTSRLIALYFVNDLNQIEKLDVRL